jgi:hypothetical protein
VYKTLLLNASYETLSFIPLRKLIKLVVKDKVEILSTWNDEVLVWGFGKMKYPAIVRMKYYVRRMPMKTRFNRRGIFRRDMFMCQYCGVVLSPSKLTLDHVHPVSAGGKSTWENCVTCCLPCNARKGNRTPEQARMALLSRPSAPRKTLDNEYILTRPKHEDWKMYFPLVEHVEQRDHAIYEDSNDY